MTFEEVMRKSAAHVAKALTLATNGQIKWEHADVPRPEAMRAFMGMGEGYMIHAVQANVVETGITHMATVTFLPECMVCNVSPQDADKLYHFAAASQN